MSILEGPEDRYNGRGKEGKNKKKEGKRPLHGYSFVAPKLSWLHIDITP